MALTLRHSEIRIQANKTWLDAYLCIAPDVRGLIIYAVPHLPRLREARESHLCSMLEEAGFGTLMLNLLTSYEEQRDADTQYDIALLSQRLEAVCEWIANQPTLFELRLGMIANGTVAASAIRLAGRNPELFTALVSKAGRIDLAGAAPLRQLHTPIFVLTPGAETDLLAATTRAYELIGGAKTKLSIAQASAGFIEPGTLDAAAQACTQWLAGHMPPREPETP